MCGIFDAKYIVVSSHPVGGKLNGNRNCASPPCYMYGLRRVVGAFPSSAKYHTSKYQLLIHLVSSAILIIKKKHFNVFDAFTKLNAMSSDCTVQFSHPLSLFYAGIGNC